MPWGMTLQEVVVRVDGMNSADRIGLFGGTFHPVHMGHRAIAESFLRSKLFDELWILVTPDPPHKPGHRTDMEPFPDRLAMTEAAFADLDRVRVSDLEARLASPHFTVHTIRSIREDLPHAKLFYCMGEDSFRSFSTWYLPEEILKEVTLVVAGRPMEAVDGRELANPVDNIQRMALEKAVFVDHNPVDISSSHIRTLLGKGSDGELERVLHPDVLSYIHENRLYHNETI